MLLHYVLERNSLVSIRFKIILENRDMMSITIGLAVASSLTSLSTNDKKQS